MISLYFGLYTSLACAFFLFIGLFIGKSLERRHCQKIIFHAYQVARTGLFVEIATCVARKITIDEMKINLISITKKRRR